MNIMKMTSSALVVLILLTMSINSEAKKPPVDYVSKVFLDGAYVPHVYDESDVVRRYGEGDGAVDETGLLRRRYVDPSTGLEVMMTSNPDIAAEFRTVDEIRVSSIATGRATEGKAESLVGLELKGVKMGDPLSKATSAARRYGTFDASRVTLGHVGVERLCGYAESGSNICFYIRDGAVVAMSVGFGP